VDPSVLTPSILNERRFISSPNRRTIFETNSCIIIIVNVIIIITHLFTNTSIKSENMSTTSQENDDGEKRSPMNEHSAINTATTSVATLAHTAKRAVAAAAEDETVSMEIEAKHKKQKNDGDRTHVMDTTTIASTTVDIPETLLSTLSVTGNNDSDQGNAKCLVYYQVLMNDERQSQITMIDVNEGDYIDSIKKMIKGENSNFFASVDSFQIEVSTAEEPEKILDSLEKWTKNVTWGTKKNPLIVKAPTTNINSGKCVSVILYFHF
jgi:hypothetical protein